MVTMHQLGVSLQVYLDQISLEQAKLRNVTCYIAASALTVVYCIVYANVFLNRRDTQRDMFKLFVVTYAYLSIMYAFVICYLFKKLSKLPKEC